MSHITRLAYRHRSSDVDDGVGVIITACDKLVLVLLLILVVLDDAEDLRFCARAGHLHLFSCLRRLPFGTILVILLLGAKCGLLVSVNLVGRL